MTEAMLNRQIKRYSNDAVRFKLKADRSYAAWKAYGDKNDYLNSQRFYEAAARAEQIKMIYELQFRKIRKGL